MEKLWLLVATAALVLGALGCGPEPAAAAPAAPEAPATVDAPAHNPDVYAYWYCSKHRSNGGMTVIHSVPYALWPGTVGYYCREDFFGNSYQYWVHVTPPGSNNSYMPWNRQHCTPQGYAICEEPYAGSA